MQPATRSEILTSEVLDPEVFDPTPDPFDLREAEIEALALFFEERTQWHS